MGLIVFAGKPVVKAPLTNDQGFFRAVLDEVDVNSAPRGGTLIGDAIRKALETMPRSRDRDQVLVLITDGEDQDSYAEDAAKEAAERGVKIFTVGLGDAGEGARIPIRDDSGRLSYMQYQGQEGWSKRNDDLLRQIALSTGGAYVPAGTQAYDLGQVYADHLAGLTRSEYQAEKRKRYREQFQWFVGFGLLLLLLDMAIPTSAVGNTLRGVTDDAAETGPAAGSGTPPKSFPPAPDYPGRLVLILAWASAASDAGASKILAGNRLLSRRQLQASGRGIQRCRFGSARRSPRGLRSRHGPGVQGDDKAVELLEKAALSPDLSLAVQARYNLGCLAAAKARKRFGPHPEKASSEDRKQGVAEVATAIGHFRDCLRMDKDHADARHNLELLRLWIKYMQSLWSRPTARSSATKWTCPPTCKCWKNSSGHCGWRAGPWPSEDDSPLHREAQRAAEKAQRKLGEEIDPLKEKIAATLDKAAQGAGPAARAAPPPPQRSRPTS